MKGCILVTMNIYLSGIGGVGIGPLAEIATDAGYTVFGSDIQQSPMTEQLERLGVNVSIGQNGENIEHVHEKTPIDWFVHSASIKDDNPELIFARNQGIRTSKRDELLSYIINKKRLKLIAIAGTHGKTTTTSLLVWCFMKLKIPISYSVGAALNFGPSGRFDSSSQYFVYECDEYDRNFLQFYPNISLIPSIGYDHSDTYKTEHVYKNAFLQFLNQSSFTLLWNTDAKNLDMSNTLSSYEMLDKSTDLSHITLSGNHTRQNAYLVQKILERLSPEIPLATILKAINSFPGSGRRFEKLANNLYSDYGHHPVEITATLQNAKELSNHIILVYQPHQNTRQHEIQHAYNDQVFTGADKIYWLPTYLSREDPSLQILSPSQLSKSITLPVKIAEMDQRLWGDICEHRNKDHLVLVMGAGDIDNWARHQLASKK